jgi:hypothetical protein
MRPFNLPTIRLAQLSKVLLQTAVFNEKLGLYKIKEDLTFELDEYWKMHYMFGRVGKKSNPGLTKNFIDLLIINVYGPYSFAVGIIEDDQSLKNKALQWLEDTKPEKNKIIQNWKKTEVRIESAFDTQALIEQKNEFCVKSLCLQCKIGQKLLKG